MKATAAILLILIAIVLAAGNALAECNCRQPAYKDQMDFVTRYMACLDECLNAQLQQIRLEMQSADRRVSELEAEIDLLQLKIKYLEIERPTGKKEQ